MFARVKAVDSSDNLKGKVIIKAPSGRSIWHGGAKLSVEAQLGNALGCTFKKRGEREQKWFFL